MKANIFIKGTENILSVVRTLSGISGLSDIRVKHSQNSVISFVYQGEDAVIKIFEKLGQPGLLEKRQVTY